jgi:hypothetical protein
MPLVASCYSGAARARQMVAALWHPRVYLGRSEAGNKPLRVAMAWPISVAELAGCMAMYPTDRLLITAK